MKSVGYEMLTVLIKTLFNGYTLYQQICAYLNKSSFSSPRYITTLERVYSIDVRNVMNANKNAENMMEVKAITNIFCILDL